MRATLIAATILAGGVLGGHQAHAGLLGDTVNGSYYFPNTTSIIFDDGSAVVSPTAVFNFDTDTTATVSDFQITITFDSAGVFNPATFSGVVITDLTASNITGVSVDAATTLAGFVAGGLSFTANSVSINLQHLTVPLGTESIVVDVASGSPVPEPVSLSLLATGLTGLGFLRRRKAS